jgi:hypothetical protein
MGLADEIRKLQELRDGGSLTEDEFTRAKSRLLSGGDPRARHNLNNIKYNVIFAFTLLVCSLAVISEIFISFLNKKGELDLFHSHASLREFVGWSLPYIILGCLAFWSRNIRALSILCFIMSIIMLVSGPPVHYDNWINWHEPKPTEFNLGWGLGRAMATGVHMLICFILLLVVGSVQFVRWRRVRQA